MSNAPDLAGRAAATAATLEQWRGVAFGWGEADCAALTAAHLRVMGHGASIPSVPRYNTILGAQRALKALGVARLPDYLDTIASIMRLPSAAFALAGDLVALPAEDSLGAICIYLGNGACLGWHPDADGCEVLTNVQAWEAAWRV